MSAPQTPPVDELDEHVRRLVDQAPELSADQRDRLAGLLRPSAERGAA